MQRVTHGYAQDPPAKKPGDLLKNHINVMLYGEKNTTPMIIAI